MYKDTFVLERSRKKNLAVHRYVSYLDLETDKSESDVLCNNDMLGNTSKTRNNSHMMYKDTCVLERSRIKNLSVHRLVGYLYLETDKSKADVLCNYDMLGNISRTPQ